jgi:uncharacterized protein with PIN domain
MSVPCPGCGREYDITLFAYGRTIECACGTRVGRDLKVLHRFDIEMPVTLRFIADVMLGRLARWLRVLGFDTCYETGIEDADLVRCSIDEQRVLLTRDRALPREWWIDSCLLVESEHPMEQVRQVVRHFDLPWRDRLFTRCTICNELLTGIDREAVIGRVPEVVCERAEAFVICPGCERIYWSGSHVERMRRRLEATFAVLPGDPSGPG